MSKSNKSVDEVLNDARDTLGQGCSDCCENIQEKIRQAPLASVIVAGAGAYVLSFFPLGALLRAIIKVTLFLIKPALFIFGVVKLVEYLKSNQASGLARKDADSERDPVIDSPVGPPSA